jgi:hypothetical protein
VNTDIHEDYFPKVPEKYSYALPEKIRNGATPMCFKNSGVALMFQAFSNLRNKSPRNECGVYVAASVAVNPQRLRY